MGKGSEETFLQESQWAHGKVRDIFSREEKPREIALRGRQDIQQQRVRKQVLERMRRTRNLPSHTAAEWETLRPLWGGVWQLVKELSATVLRANPQEKWRCVHAETCTWMFTAPLFTIVKTWRHHQCPSMDEGLTGDGISIQWNITRPRKGMKSCYVLHRGWTLKTLCQVKEASHRKLHVTWPHFHESHKWDIHGQKVDWGWAGAGEGMGVMDKGYRVSLWGDKNVLKTGYGCTYLNIQKIAGSYTCNGWIVWYGNYISMLFIQRNYGERFSNFNPEILTWVQNMAWESYTEHLFWCGQHSHTLSTTSSVEAAVHSLNYGYRQ